MASILDAQSWSLVFATLWPKYSFITLDLQCHQGVAKLTKISARLVNSFPFKQRRTKNGYIKMSMLYCTYFLVFNIWAIYKDKILKFKTNGLTNMSVNKYSEIFGGNRVINFCVHSFKHYIISNFNLHMVFFNISITFHIADILNTALVWIWNEYQQ